MNNANELRSLYNVHCLFYKEIELQRMSRTGAVIVFHDRLPFSDGVFHTVGQKGVPEKAKIKGFDKAGKHRSFKLCM